MPRLRFDALEDRLVPSTIVVSSPDDAGNGTLRQAIIVSNATGVLDDIRIDVGTVDLLGALPTITDSVNIFGNPEATIHRADLANGNFRYFDIAAGVDADLSGLILKGAINDDDGGAIRNLGNLTLTNSQVIENSAKNKIEESSSVREAYGGGIYSNGTLFLGNCYVALNRVEVTKGSIHSDGGGIALLGGCATFDAVSIDRNSATKSDNCYGGGMYVKDSTVTMTHCAITRNTAGSYSGHGDGGGVFMKNSDCTLTLSTVAFNQADGEGGLVALIKSLTLDRCIIASNIGSGYDVVSFHSADYNLVRNTVGASGPSNHNIYGADPHLIMPEVSTQSGNWTLPMPILALDSPARNAGPGGTDIGATTTDPIGSPVLYSRKKVAPIGTGASTVTFAIDENDTLQRHDYFNWWHTVATGVRSVAVTIDPSGYEVVFAIFNDQTLRRWRSAYGWHILGNWATSVSAGRDSSGQPLAWVTGADGALNVWRTNGGWTPKPLTGPHAVRSIAATDDNRCTVLLEDRSVRVYTPTSSDLIATSGFARSLDAVSINGTLTVYAVTPNSQLSNYGFSQGWNKVGDNVGDVAANSSGSTPFIYLLTALSDPYSYDSTSGFKMIGGRDSIRYFAHGRGGAGATLSNNLQILLYAPEWSTLTGPDWTDEL